MHVDLFQSEGQGDATQLLNVFNVRMHAAITQQAHDVERLIFGFRFLHGSQQNRVVCHRTLLKRFVDLRQHLPNHSPCPYVHMTHLRIAHLSYRQPHILTIGAQGSMRIARKQRICKRRDCLIDGIRMRAISQAPSIQNHQTHFFNHSTKVQHPVIV